MQLESYLKRNKLKPTPWAEKHGISAASLHRYLKGIGTIDARNALRIEAATDEQVTVKELLERYKYQLSA
jgi:DNA-binding transcriptional regulator YdaS (Cro superfamily)